MNNFCKFFEFIFFFDMLSVEFIIIISLSLFCVFIYIIFNCMYSDLIMCYVALEGALLTILILFGCCSFIFLDIRSLVFLVFLISIAACEIAIGLAFLVRYR